MNPSELSDQSLYQSNVNYPDQPQEAPITEEQKNLPFSLKFVHEKWQVRRLACSELSDLINGTHLPTEVHKEYVSVETVSKWLVDRITQEKNLNILPDVLKTFKSYMAKYSLSKSSIPSLTGSLLNRLVVTKTQIQQLVYEVFDKLIEIDDMNAIPNEILNRLKDSVSKNNKFTNAILHLLSKYTQRSAHFDEHFMRLTFKAMLPMLNHSNKETRQVSLEVVKTIFSFIEESYEAIQGLDFGDIKGNLKELENLKNVKKVQGRRLVRLNDGTFSKKHNHDHKIDLGTLLPKKYTEIPFLAQNQPDQKHHKQLHQNEKRRLLEEFNNNIEQALKSYSEIDGTKDYFTIIKLIIPSLEENNILINQEAIKTISHLVKICKEKFPFAQLKYILGLVIEKLDPRKKTLYNTSLLTLLDESLMYRAISPENLTEILLSNAETNKSMNVRSCCIGWFSHNFVSFLTGWKDIFATNLTENTEPSTRPGTAASNANSDAKRGRLLRPEERINRVLQTIYKRIQGIVAKETHLPLKRECQELLDKLTRASIPQDYRDSALEGLQPIHELSMIKGSKFTNMSGHQMDSITAPYMTEGEELKEELMDSYPQERSSATMTLTNESVRRSEMSFDHLKPEEKEQYNRLATLLNDFKPQDDQLLEKIEAVGPLLDKTNIDLIQATQDQIVKRLKKTIIMNFSDRKTIIQFFEHISSLLIKINKLCVGVTEKTLRTELKIVILFLSNLQTPKQIEKILESAFMTCPLDKFLSVSIKLFEKCDQKYIRVVPPERLANSLRMYLNWLTFKVERSQGLTFDDNQVRTYEKALSTFKFSNLPQVHHPILSVLSKKAKLIDETQSSLDQSIRSYETPRVKKYKAMSVEPGQRQERSNLDDINDIESSQISMKLKHIEAEIKSDLHTGIEKFSSLLSSIKKKNLERSNLSSCLSPPQSFHSPNRHWKRGVGREGNTPKRNSFRNSLQFGQLRDEAASKLMCPLNLEETLGIVENIMMYISEKEVNVFEDSLYKLKCICPPKDLMQVLRMILSRAMRYEFYGERLSRESILRILTGFSETLDRGLILATFKDVFQQLAKVNQRAMVLNTARVAMDLALAFYPVEEIPRRLVSPLVEMIVYGLTEPDLKERSELFLNAFLKTYRKDDMKKMFELELIHSFKLYQIFGNWVDVNCPEPVTVAATISPRKASKILIQDQEGAPSVKELQEESFNKTPERSNMKIGSNQKPYLRNAIEEAFEGSKHQDLRQLAFTLMKDEQPVTGTGTETAFQNTEEKMRHQNPNILHESEFQYSELTNVMDTGKKASSGSRGLSNNASRKILGERENDLNLDINSLASKLQTESVITLTDNLENKENSNLRHFNKPSVSVRYGLDKFDNDSAEKWKGKYIGEKEKLQATIELLEKANHGYLSQVTEKTELLSKLESQRKVNESLLEKFNIVSKENDSLKRTNSTLEVEKERLSQTLQLANQNTRHSVQTNRKVRENLAIMAKAAEPEEQIRMMQEMILTSNSLEVEIGETLLRMYEELEDYGEKLHFIINLKNSVLHQQVLDNLSPQNQKFLLEISLRLCISENTQKEIILGSDGVTFVETQLTTEMQVLLDALLRYHNLNATLANLLKILSDTMPTEFSEELNKSQKMLLKLTVKCLVRLSANFKGLVGEDIRVFDILLEIYKLFKLHPPETLKEDQPNIKDYETIFRNIRTLADNVIDLGPSKAREFAGFFNKESSKSIFLDYVRSYTDKYYPNITNMSFNFASSQQ